MLLGAGRGRSGRLECRGPYADAELARLRAHRRCLIQFAAQAIYRRASKPVAPRPGTSATEVHAVQPGLSACPTALKFPGLWVAVSGFPGLVTVWRLVGHGGVTGRGGTGNETKLQVGRGLSTPIPSAGSFVA